MEECRRCDVCVIQAECDAIDEYVAISKMSKMYDELIEIYNKGYDKGRADERAKVIEVSAKVISSLVGICKNSCPIDCDWGTEESCIESWKIYLAEQLKEQENE